VKKVRILNKTRNSVLGTSVSVADGWWSRTRGFLGQRAPDAGEGILLSPCRGLHMIGMSFPLDAIFISMSGVVVALHPDMKPGTRTPLYSSAEYAIELPAGSIEASGTREGDVVVWTPAEEGTMPPNSASARTNGVSSIAGRSSPTAEA
jgi:uncharacterized protein